MMLMSLTHKPGPASSIFTGHELPQRLPEIPEPVTKRFPEMAEYAMAMSEWWEQTKRTLQRIHDETKTAIDASASKETVAALTSRMDAIEPRVDQIEGM